MSRPLEAVALHRVRGAHQGRPYYVGRWSILPPVLWEPGWPRERNLLERGGRKGAWRAPLPPQGRDEVRPSRSTSLPQRTGRRGVLLCVEHVPPRFRVTHQAAAAPGVKRRQRHRPGRGVPGQAHKREHRCHRRALFRAVAWWQPGGRCLSVAGACVASVGMA
jgi:hypothetical protein